MTKRQKAVFYLESIGIPAKEEFESVYVFIEDVMLEISEFEINFQADRFDKEEG